MGNVFPHFTTNITCSLGYNGGTFEKSGHKQTVEEEADSFLSLPFYPLFTIKASTTNVHQVLSDLKFNNMEIAVFITLKGKNKEKDGLHDTIQYVDNKTIITVHGQPTGRDDHLMSEALCRHFFVRQGQGQLFKSLGYKATCRQIRVRQAPVGTTCNNLLQLAAWEVWLPGVLFESSPAVPALTTESSYHHCFKAACFTYLSCPVPNQIQPGFIKLDGKLSVAPSCINLGKVPAPGCVNAGTRC